ncbi:MAG TPA: thiamine phosphate synthase [Vicinamibacterales bacterium]|nr:thiamine phosphate synthase [Vicinamibacterales bacterium]
MLPVLYPIVDADLCRLRGVDPRHLVRAFVAGGARVLQVRQKNANTGPLLALVRGVIEDAWAGGASLIVNDRADVAAMAGADGVHVGQQDLPPDDVRRIAGDRPIIGISTHTEAQVDEAVAGPADYVAVGPVFQTLTKNTGYDARGLDLVAYAAGRGKPVVAIGGITLQNAPDVLAAGAASVAVISDLLSGEPPETRVRRYLERLQRPAP